MLGKHTDYAGGRSLLCAVERGFHVSIESRSDTIVSITDKASGARDAFALDPELAAAPQGHWATYPRTVARRLARNFPDARRGATIEFHSDLPQAAGLSSSSAFMIAVFLALAAANDLESHEEYARVIRSREDLATYLACVENGTTFRTLEGDRGVGTTGGSEDHTAILCCKAGRLSVYSFSPPRLERTVPIPDRHVFAIATSGVSAEKTGAAMAHYNRAAAQTSALLGRWTRLTGRMDGSLAAALSSEPEATVRLRGALGDPADAVLAGRLEQFVEESNVLIPAAADAIEAGDLASFGEIVDRSQHLAERALGNQIPETIALARSARALGAAAASAFGAGFGGSVWALVPEREADPFIGRWRDRYHEEFPRHAAAARFFTTGAAGAATEV